MHLRRNVLGAAPLVIGLVLAACSAGAASPSVTADAGGTESPVVASGAGELTSDLDLEVGDCFNTSDDPAQVEIVSCDEPHVFEAYAVFRHQAGAEEAYPGEDAVFEFADAQCRERFADYVGVDYERSSFFYTSVSPSAETWAAGDRESVCALHTDDESPVAGSAQGSAR